MVFTSTSGGPTSAAIRSTTLRAAAGSVGSAVSRRMPSGSSFSPSSLRSAPDHCEPGGRQLLRRRTAELTARADHDRHTLAHTATSMETAPKKVDTAFLLPVLNGPDCQGRVQVHRREGEKPSPDSGDLARLRLRPPSFMVPQVRSCGLVHHHVS